MKKALKIWKKHAFLLKHQKSLGDGAGSWNY